MPSIAARGCLRWLPEPSNARSSGGRRPNVCSRRGSTQKAGTVGNAERSYRNGDTGRQTQRYTAELIDELEHRSTRAALMRVSRAGSGDIAAVLSATTEQEWRLPKSSFRRAVALHLARKKPLRGSYRPDLVVQTDSAP